MKNKHFVIITGYPNKEIKIKYLTELSSKIKNKMNDSVDLCYCTHHPNISKEIYDLFDYVIYNKNNPILNWDISDDFTKTFGCQVDVGNDMSLLYFQPYHGFAHHISICDGISLGINTGHNKFTLMNYDCIDFCVDELPDHITEIQNEKYNAIFYPYTGIEDQDLNTEFFTFDLKFATLLSKLRSYRNFSSKEYMMYERIITDMVRDNKIKILMKNFDTENKALGKISYADDLTSDELNDKFFAPFYEKWIDGKRYCYYFFPIINEGKRYIVFIDETKNNMKCTAKINNVLVPYPPGTLMELSQDKFNLEIFDDGKRVANLFIHDDRQYGVFKRKLKNKLENEDDL